MFAWLLIALPMLLWAAALWPAVMVADSVDTWNQAAAGPVVDWHSPVYTYLQRAAYLSVGSPAAVVLLQILGLSYAIRRVLGVVVSIGVRPLLAYGFGAGVAILPPVGAFPSHLIKDVPYAIGFLLALAFIADLAAKRCGLIPEGTTRRSALVLFALGLTFLLLMRVNGPIAAAGFGVAAVLLARQRLRVVVACVASLAAYLFVTLFVYPAAGVVDAPPNVSAGIYVIGLSAAYQQEPELVAESAVDDLELWATQEEYEEQFNCHWAGTPFQSRFYTPMPVSPDDLSDAWREVLFADPLLLVGTHLCAASPAWNPIASPEERIRYQTLWDVVVENPQGVVSDPFSDRLGAAARNVLAFVGLTNEESRAWNPVVSQFLLWRASTWMYVLAGLVTAGVVRFRRWWGLALLVPLAAQAVSVIALAGPHYRYTAPVWIGSVLLIPLGGKLAIAGSGVAGPRLAEAGTPP